MNATFTYPIDDEFADTIGDDGIELEAKYHIENDGIGSYEYWGFGGYDKGEDYAELDDVLPIFEKDATPEYKKMINKYVDDNYDAIKDYFYNSVDLREDYDGPEPDFD